MKKVLTALTEKGAPAETIDEFKKAAPAAVKKILGNYDNYDVLMGQTMDGDAMYVFQYLIFNWLDLVTNTRSRHVLIDFREDGVTPYATLWKHGLEEMKV
jgi:hypothetical protein